MNKRLSLICSILLVSTTLNLNSADQNLFDKGTIESKIWNGVKIAAGSLAILGTYRQKFLFGTASTVAGIICITSGIIGLEKDISASRSFIEKTKSKLKNAFDDENSESKLESFKLRIQNTLMKWFN